MFDPIDFARQNIKYHTGKDWPTELGRVNYILRGDGLWEVRKNRIGTFFVRAANHTVGGFPPETRREGFELAVPKIPRPLLGQVLAFFRQLCESHDFEAYIQIWWNPEKQEYFLHCPVQKVSKGRVKYEPSDDVAPTNILVCEIHSHNSMGAFFSSIDDADEKSRGDRFFGVVGNLDTDHPNIKLSFIIGGGKRVYVALDDLFEPDTFPQEWLQKIFYLDREANPEFSPKKSSGDDDEGFEEDVEEGVESQDVYDNMDLVQIGDEDELAFWMQRKLRREDIEDDDDLMDIGASKAKILRKQLDLIGE